MKEGIYKTGGWNAHFILIVCSLLYMVNYMDRHVLSVVLQPMKRDLEPCGLCGRGATNGSKASTHVSMLDWGRAYEARMERR